MIVELKGGNIGLEDMEKLPKARKDKEVAVVIVPYAVYKGFFEGVRNEMIILRGEDGCGGSSFPARLACGWTYRDKYDAAEKPKRSKSKAKGGKPKAGKESKSKIKSKP
jgi:hypothetical protein